MTPREAGQAVAVLNAYFPREALEPETVAVWVEEIRELASPELAVAAARTCGRGLDRFPTIREYLDTYRRLRDRQRDDVPSIEAVTSGPRELPESVRQWLANGPRSA